MACKKIHSIPVILLLIPCISMGQFIEATFPAPCSNISGLACTGNGVLVLDALELNLYRVNGWTGEVYSIVSLPGSVSMPVGLGVMDSTVYFAENGTALIHSMMLDGTYLDTWNFADSGLVSITGIDFAGDDWMFVLDGNDRSVYRLEIPMGIQPMVKMFTISDDIEVYDIGSDYFGVPVACSDPVSPVRFYYDDDDYDVLGMGTYMSASGVGTTGDERIYFSDPLMNAIHRYSPTMGGTGEEAHGSGLLLGIIVNPSPGTSGVVIRVQTDEQAFVRIFDLSGRKVEETEVTPGTSELCITDLAPGVYLCTLSGEEGSTELRFSVTE